ncbi:MAG: hypothetical protein HC913_04970 [Microscillaceae bacterium]|nr:hypothetical protein [Microscillaceae bacterium]
MSILDWFSSYASLPYHWYAQYYPYSVLPVLVGLYFLYGFLINSWLWFTVLNPFRGMVARVVRVADGDTLIVKRLGRRYKVRLIGVDTPESLRSLYQSVMPFGKEASEYTKKRLRKGKRVFLYYDREARDKFGRLLAYVYLSRGEFFNATLVRKGYAFAKEYPPNVRHSRYLTHLEKKARFRRRGLWTIYRSHDDLRHRYLQSRQHQKFRKIYG